jgi:N-acetylglutamate synthase
MGEMRDERAIERLALACWPASQAKPYGEWLLRTHYGGVTKRANSVMTLGSMPAGDPAAWISEIEAYYRRSGMLPCYYVSDHSPEGLDGLLASHGYREAYPCILMTADGERLMRASRPLSISVELQGASDERWLDEFLELEQFPDSRRPAYAKLFADMPQPKAYLRAAVDGQTAALGTAVSSDGWTIVYNIVTAERHRRKGAARAIMRAIAEWSLRQGAERLLLQVLRDNHPAIAMYEQLGFSPFCQQHYRVHPEEPIPGSS